MAQKRAIGYVLKKKLSKDNKLKVVEKWTIDKQTEIQSIIFDLNNAVKIGDNIAYQKAIKRLVDFKLKSIPAVNGIAQNLIFGEFSDDEK